MASKNDARTYALIYLVIKSTRRNSYVALHNHEWLRKTVKPEVQIVDRFTTGWSPPNGKRSYRRKQLSEPSHVFEGGVSSQTFSSRIFDF